MGRFATTTRRALTLAAVVALATTAGVLVLPARPAAAVTTARSNSTATATSGSWAAVLVNSNGTDSLGQQMSWSWLIGGSPVYISVRNNGSLPLNAQTYSLARSGLVGSFTATACIGATWNTSTGNCPTSNTLVLDSTSSGSTAASLALAVNGSVSIKVSGSTSVLTTVTLSVSVSRSQARTATTTNT